MDTIDDKQLASADLPPKHVKPSVNEKSFSCPHCGALASQSWYELRANRVENDGLPRVWTAIRLDNLKRDADAARDPVVRDKLNSLLEQAKTLATGRLFFSGKDSDWARYEVQNLTLSKCYRCKELAVWKHDTMLYPRHRFDVEPNEDLSPEIKSVFEEAREVLELSPRSAAALLRVCVQMLCAQLGQTSDNLNIAIGNLVEGGLPTSIQKALDIVRVVGNEAVHPGTLDFRDNREIAEKLFLLVNMIAYDQITRPAEIHTMFDGHLSDGQKAQIAKRDKGSSST